MRLFCCRNQSAPQYVASRHVRAAVAVVICAGAALACDRQSSSATLTLAHPAEFALAVDSLSDSLTWVLSVKSRNGEEWRMPEEGPLVPGELYQFSAAGDAAAGNVQLTIRALRCRDAAADKGCKPARLRFTGDSVDRTLLALVDDDDRPLLLHARMAVPLASLPRPDTTPAGDARGDLRITVVQPTPSERFTTRDGENELRLRAAAGRRIDMSSIRWVIVADSAAPGVIAVAEPPPGEETVLRLDPGDPRRWERHRHGTRLEDRVLSVFVQAEARQGDQVVRSAPLRLQQDAIAAMRQEYHDLRLARGVPNANEFIRDANTGDYDYVVRNPEFWSKLRQLRQQFGGRWQVNSLYRNPVHNKYHIGAGSANKPAPNSWHQYGCAADIQIFPRVTASSSAQERAQARAFRDGLVLLAQDLGFTTLLYGGHVHVQLPCR